MIGINDYHHVQKLDYARNDASAFADYLSTNLDIKPDHLFELYDGRATKRNIHSLLGTQIRSKEREVPEATGQRQHPVKKGKAEGQVVIGRVR